MNQYNEQYKGWDKFPMNKGLYTGDGSAVLVLERLSGTDTYDEICLRCGLRFGEHYMWNYETGIFCPDEQREYREIVDYAEAQWYLESEGKRIPVNSEEKCRRWCPDEPWTHGDYGEPNDNEY